MRIEEILAATLESSSATKLQCLSKSIPCKPHRVQLLHHMAVSRSTRGIIVYGEPEGDTLSNYLSELYPQKFQNVTQSTRLLLAYLCIAFRNVHLLHSINALTSDRIDDFQNLSQYRGFLKRKGKGGFASFCSDIVDLFDFDEDTATNMEPSSTLDDDCKHYRKQHSADTLRQGLCVGVPVSFDDKTECKTFFPRKFKPFDVDPDDDTDNRPRESVAIKKKQKISCSRCGRQSTNVAFCKVCKQKLCINSNNDFLRKKGEGGENILAQPFLHPVRHIEDDVHFLNSCFLIEQGDLSSGAIHKHMQE
eukprot:Pgem_evm3s9654